MNNSLDVLLSYKEIINYMKKVQRNERINNRCKKVKRQC